MTRAAAIAGVLLEVEDFDPREYLTSPEQKTLFLLDELKGKLQPWYDQVEVHPAPEGTAFWPKFFHGGNRYRIRCKRTRPVPKMTSYRGYPLTACEFRSSIDRVIRGVLEAHSYYLAKIEFSGDTFRNVLIMIDMWPYDKTKSNEV